MSDREVQNPIDGFKDTLEQLQTLLIEAANQSKTDEERVILLERIERHRRHLDKLEQDIENRAE